MPRRSHLPAVLLAALLLAAFACANGRGPDAAASRDAAIRDAIEEDLRRDSIVERIPVRVRVEDGHVVLYGSVDTPRESERAEEIARATDGVRHVENHLRVGAGSDPGDRQLPIEAIQPPGPMR